MKSIIEKQLVQWKEELAKQVKTKDQAEKVLMEANKAILMIEGGIQAKEMILRKFEQESQVTGIVELEQPVKRKPSK
jgi:hypothetical protein